MLAFIESTLHHLGDKTVGLFRADSSFFDEAILTLLEGRKIDYMIVPNSLSDCRRPLCVRDARWWALETGLELAGSHIRHRAVLPLAG